jgi:type II secretory ATPase GspE/PulE/Tfp pilus assembly ATPase PilB-like protein
MKLDANRLKAFILDTDLVNKKDFDKALRMSKKTKKPLEEVLVDHRLITHDDLARLKAYITGIPFINLEKSIIPQEVLDIIPEPLARSNNIVPFKKEKKSLEVAMLDPQDLQTIDFIKKKSNLKILPRLTTPEGIKNVLSQYRKTLKAEFQDFIAKESEDVRSIKVKKGEEDPKDLEKVAEEMPVIRIVDTLLKHAVLDRSSDIHIEPNEKEVIVRYRIDGILHDAMTLPRQIAPGIVARIKVLSDLKLDEHRLPQDGRFKFDNDGDKYSIRVSCLPVLNGEKIVMRLLSENAKGFSLDELGLRGEALESIEGSIRRPTGMILVTGPTGSGKTTTLYSILEILNTPEVNISTIEDPIEYQIPRINQTQVRPKIGLTFANGLRSLLRQDPDIIMVGEIRDKETAALAINAALTGHLVLSTLHTNDAAGAIPRLIDMKVEPFLLASTLNVVLAQRLVRKLCDGKKEVKLTAATMKKLLKNCDADNLLKILKEEKITKTKQSIDQVKFFQSEKTKTCPEGFKGRMGIYEVLPITETIKELIAGGAFSDQIKDQAVKEGMRTMVEDGLLKAAQGATTIEEVLRVVME